MHKKIKICTLITLFAITLITSLGINANASVGWIRKLKLYQYDLNKFSSQRENIKNLKYIDVPSTAVFTHDETTQIGEAWNYTRYQVINYYQSDQGFH